MSVHLKPSQTVNTNLYCCNLPLAADKSDLIALFTPFGRLTHCTILATLDSAGRRRAFLDFATPAEAAQAKQSTHTMLWHGYALEVTYATVQRSTGPLSIYEAPPGGWDRPPPRTNSEARFEYVPAPETEGEVNQKSFGSSSGSEVGRAEGGEGATVVVIGLDLMAVGSPGALLGLFNRFGTIKHAYVDAPNQIGVLSFEHTKEAQAAATKMDGAHIGRNVIGAVIWEEWEAHEREQNSDQGSATDWKMETDVTHILPPAPSISPSPPTFSPSSTAQQFYTTANVIGTSRLPMSCTSATALASTAARPVTLGATSTLTSSPGWNPAANATRPAPALGPEHVRSPLGQIQLNPAAQEFTARR